MPTISDIKAVHITLTVDDRRSLFILLAADGSINRLGTGAVTNKDNDFFIGITPGRLFERLVSHLNDEMLSHMGSYDVPEKRGPLCELLVGFVFASDEGNGFGFRYGAKSQGPPHEIAQFVEAAVELTNPWFERQKRLARSPKGSGKPWWKFW